MKRVVIALTLVALVGGVAYGQRQSGPNFEHLKQHRTIIGTWRYEGPLLEGIPDIAEKGSKVVNELSWKWILERNAVEVSWRSEFAGGKSISGKGLIGWNSAEEKISFGGMDSIGGMSLGTIEFTDDGKSNTLTSEGIDGDGENTTFTGVIKMTGKDSFTWQATQRGGGLVDGPSPVYAYKRVARETKKKPKQELPSFRTPRAVKGPGIKQ